MGLALNKLGYSLNDTNPSHLKEAEKDLNHLTPQVRGVVGDEVTMMLEQNEGNIAVVWSGVAAPLVQDSNKYNYVIPKEGSNLWFDNMVIPKTAQNKEGAYKFMNFLLDAKNNKQNTEWVGYATPNKVLVSYYLKKLEMIIVFILPKRAITIRSLQRFRS